MKVNLFDFDGTIYDGDSSIDFYLFCLKRKFYIIKYLPTFIIYIFLYKLKIKSKEEMKEKFFMFIISFDNIDTIVNDFWNKNTCKIKRFYLERNHENDIIISASPYFLLKPISQTLKVKDLIASNIDKKTAKYIGKNCYDQEKVNLLKEKYPNIIVEETFTDSLNDKPILNLANKSYLVKKNKIQIWCNKNK